MPPDVRVRLTAEGVAEVIGALEKVRAKSEQVGSTSAKAFGGLNAALAGTRALLAQLGVVLSVGVFVNTVTGSIAAAESLQKLSQSAGASTTNLQILARAAKGSGTEIDQLSKALGVFAKASTDAIESGGKMSSALRAVGFTGAEIQNLSGKDTVERFAALSEKFAALEDGAKKTTLAVEIFGQKLGPGLIPLMNDLGKTGIGPVKKELEELGILMDEDLVAELGAVDSGFKFLGDQARGLAGQFAGGLAPALHSSLSAISQNLKGSSQVWQEFGTILGFVVRVLVALVVPVLDLTITVIKSLADAIGGAVAVTKRVLRGDLVGAYAEADNRLTGISARMGDTVKRTGKLWVNLFTDVPAEAAKAGKQAEANLSEIYKTRRERLKAEMDAEIALIRAAIRTKEDTENRSFERGLVSITEHFAKRRKLAAAAIAEEIAAIRKKALFEQAAEENSEKRIAIAVKANSENRILVIKGFNDAAAMDEEEFRRTKEFGEKAIDIEGEIQEAQGKRHAIELERIRREVQERRKTLVGISAIGPGEEDDQLRTLERFEKARRLQLEFSEATKATNAALTSYGRARAEIEDQASAGLISQVESQAQLLQLEKERLATLRERAGEALRIAAESGDPEKIDQAQQVVDSVERIALAVSAAGDTLLQTKAVAIDAFGDSLVRTLGEGEIASLSFGNVFKSVLLDVSQALRRFFAQLLVTQALMAIFGGRRGSGTGIFEGVVGGELTPIRRAEGGPVIGPGSSTSDSIIARLSAGEYVVRAAAVARPGMLQTLESINFGTPSFRIPSMGDMRFAEGGYVGSSPAPASVNGNFTLGLEEGLVERRVERWMSSPAGSRMIVKTLSANRNAVTSVLGRG